MSGFCCSRTLAIYANFMHLWMRGCAPQAFKGMKSLLMSTVFSYTNSKGQNIFWPGIQYAGKMQPLIWYWKLVTGKPQSMCLERGSCCTAEYMQPLVLLPGL